jgi:hypothetical protein
MAQMFVSFYRSVVSRFHVTKARGLGNLWPRPGKRRAYIILLAAEIEADVRVRADRYGRFPRSARDAEVVEAVHHHLLLLQGAPYTL